MANFQSMIPIYTTRGDVDAFLVYPYLYSRQGEWIGWVTDDRFVYSVHGHYVGWVADGPRILRKIADGFDQPRIHVTPPEERAIRMPPTVPLAPLMAELTHGVVDVLLEAPELLPAVDFGDLREDMD